MAGPTGSGYSNQGLGNDLLDRPYAPLLQGLAGGLLQGAAGITPAPPQVSEDDQSSSAYEPTPEQSPARLTDKNVQLLGRILTSECQGTCNPDEIQGVGSTLINRMNRANTDDVSDVSHGYSVKTDPAPGMMWTAARLLSGQLGDNTGGATHFYSPVSMPKLGQDTGGHDVSGGTELIPGHTVQNWRPGFAVKYPQSTVPGADDWVVKFYTQPGTGHVD